MNRLGIVAGVVLTVLLVAPLPGTAGALSADGRAGSVTAVQGLVLARPAGRDRWTALDARSLVFPGDVVRTDARGANAAEVRLVGGGRLVLGPGTTIELATDGRVRLLRGEAEVRSPDTATLAVAAPGGWTRDVKGTLRLSAGERETKELADEPSWLKGYRASTTDEWMGSLLAKVDGKDVPLSVGYHKVTVEIRDQIARTTVEESFVNATDATLEGVFSFPLPADASISGFGMWIGEDLVEADLVERERAREIYEDILRRKKDPGLLEWEGGNLFKARVYPIPPRAEKRIRIRYTEVLPLEGDAFRYRYALRSELLRAHPLRELAITLNVVSEAPIRSVASPTHEVVTRSTEYEASIAFNAQQYVPERDFEVAVSIDRGEGLSAISHRRGGDGWFLLLVAPPDPSAAGWRRDLVPDGRPLDLVVVADTSGSMDARAREVQASFVSALLG
ncbi:MAG TPA: VIT domain-containing protein, partial [Planctomycetota bacterium]|nr:VIT domain-containing protein [Planctomycetota bacterium]